MTGNQIIELCLLLILVIHIVKIKNLQEDNARLWRNLQMLSKVQSKQISTISKAADAYVYLSQKVEILERQLNSTESSKGQQGD